ncbi:ATP-binding protein [Mucilaginibacter myungsuensis]|uniref:histidine kinase n=1 Tax=Mucilaginibacter myungsuensis TaxID=649104 RepID=A0A929PXQ2_9SPHI|nr:ATP-binding protein [Mucilaginibacter myungsuensis]MBE9664098.1 sensor histidine kinase [Mucilaginibacter myungsuensis]MDN3601277.1 sensor histidine kinase [Mucilaginibacter myungsuensis]
MIRYFALVLCFLFAVEVSAQKKVDSLRAVLTSKAADTLKIKALNDLSYELVETDTALSHNYAKQALKRSEAIDYHEGKVEAWYNIAYFYELLYKRSVAVMYYKKGIALAEQKNLIRAAATGYQDYAVVLKKDREFKKALELNLKAITLYKKIDDKPHLGIIYTNVGNCYSNMNLPEMAITYHIRSLKISQELKHNSGITKAYNNIGIVYERSGNFEKALESYLRMLEPAKAAGKKSMLAAANGNIGSAYVNLKQQAKALPYLLTAYNEHLAMADKARIALDLNNLAACYNDLQQYNKAYKASIDGLKFACEAKDTESEAYAYITAGAAMAGLKDHNKAQRLMDTAYTKSVQVGGPAVLMAMYEQTANVYRKTGDYKKVMEFTDKLISLKDSTYNAEKHAQIAALHEQYDSQHKDKIIAENALADLNNKIQISKKNRLLGGLGGSVTILLVIAGLVGRNMSLKARKLESEKALAAAEAEQGMLNEKLRISGELHDNIGSQLTFIHSSIQNIRSQEGGRDQAVLQEAEEIAVKTIRDLRQTVWFINNTTFTADDFAIRLREYVKPYLSIGSTAVNINNTVPADVQLSSAAATHLFRIVQEAINNAIKYANASQILVDMHPTEGSGGVSVIVSDDGGGFDTTVASAGFGIRSMEVRAEKAGGKLAVFSAVGKGTSVKVNIPVG